MILLVMLLGANGAGETAVRIARSPTDVRFVQVGVTIDVTGPDLAVIEVNDLHRIRMIGCLLRVAAGRTDGSDHRKRVGDAIY